MNAQLNFSAGTGISITGADTANTSSMTFSIPTPIRVITGSSTTLTLNDHTLIVGSFVNSVVTLPSLSGSFQDGTTFLIKNQGSNTCTISASHDVFNPGTVGSSDKYSLLSGKFAQVQSLLASGWYVVANN